MATQIERATRQAGLHIPNLEETGRRLGEGAYGEVVEVRVRGKRYAGKKLHKIFYERDVPPADTSAIAQRFEEECRRMPHLKHPNIVQMIGVHFHPRTGQPTLVMELLDTSLTRYLEEHASTPPAIKHSILLGVASGLVYLHTLSPPLGPIIHRDLTANNVLLRLGEEVIAKIADLGQARIVGRNPAQMARLTKYPGNPDHMPPEAQIDDPVYGTALDIFSFGVVMLHTLAHEWPEPLSKLKSAYRVRSEVERRKTYLDKIEGSLLKPLVVECLGDSAESRPAAGELTGALKLAMKLHPQMQSMTEAHEDVLHQMHDLQQQLQAQQLQEQQQKKVLGQQVRQLELKNQELARKHSEQKQTLEQNIQQHIQEKELLQQQLHQDQQQLVKTGQELIELKLQNQQLAQIQSKQRQRQDQEVQWPRAHENLHQKLLPIPLPQPQAQQWPPLPSSSFPLPLLPTSTPSHAPIIPPEPPGPNATQYTQYQNVQYQSAGSGSANIADLLQSEAKSEATLENTTITQEIRKLIQQYPELAGLPPQRKNTEQPATYADTRDLYDPEQSASDDDTIDLYGDDSNPVPVDTHSEPSSPGRLDKPTPRTRRSRSPSPHSSTENSPSARPTPARRKMPPVPEHSSQPPGPQLGVSMPPKAQSVDAETQRKKEIRRQNLVDRFSSGNLEAVAAALSHTFQASPSPAYVPEPPPTQKSSCDIPPNAPVMGISPQAAAAAKRKQGNDLSSQLPSDQLPPSQPSYGQPFSQAPGQLPQSHSSQLRSDQLLQNKAPSQPLHSQQISSQPPTQVPPSHPSQPPPDQPLAHNVPSPTSKSRPLNQPLHSQYAASQPSSHQPDWPRSQQEQHRQPPRELPATHPPSDQRTLGPPGPLPPKSAPSLYVTTAVTERVDTCESDQSDLDQRRPNRQSIESLEKNLGQDNSKLWRQEHGKEPVARKRSTARSDSSNPHRKSKEFNSSAKDVGSDNATVPWSLWDTWTCAYCTNLVQATLRRCEICGHEKLETTP